MTTELALAELTLGGASNTFAARFLAEQGLTAAALSDPLACLDWLTGMQQRWYEVEPVEDSEGTIYAATLRDVTVDLFEAGIPPRGATISRGWYEDLVDAVTTPIPEDLYWKVTLNPANPWRSNPAQQEQFGRQLARGSLFQARDDLASHGPAIPMWALAVTLVANADQWRSRDYFWQHPAVTDVERRGFGLYWQKVLRIALR